MGLIIALVIAVILGIFIGVHPEIFAALGIGIFYVIAIAAIFLLFLVIGISIPEINSMIFGKSIFIGYLIITLLFFSPAIYQAIKNKDNSNIKVFKSSRLEKYLGIIAGVLWIVLLILLLFADFNGLI